ncbi:MAG: ATP-binding protein [Oscillospiraceae bacterium]|nr:ATP-binding protein [Oscillospiraceae bacterium]
MMSVVMKHAVKPDYRLKEDEYLNDDGFAYCKNCHTPRQYRFTLEGRTLIVHAKCNCKDEKRKQEEEQWQARSQRDQILHNRSIGLPDQCMKDHTFEKDLGYHSYVTEIAKNYVKHWENLKARKQGGLLFWGNVGTGKSFTAHCIANALLDKGVRVLVTNMSRLLNELQKPQTDKNRFLDDLNSFELLIIDDFGVERDTDYTREQVYNIIDSRVRSTLPLIITTNFTLQALQHPSDIGHARIFSRVLELCTPISVNEQDIRKILRVGEMKEIKELLLPDEEA